MNTAELTAMNAETLTGMSDSRKLANITRRAQTLFAEGYTAKNAPQSGAYYVTSPALPGDVNGDTKKTYKVRCSPLVGYACTCPCFDEMITCKHLEAVDMMLRAEDEAADAEWERIEECMNFFNGRYDR